MPDAPARPVAPTLTADTPHVFAVWMGETREQAAELVAAAAGAHVDLEAQMAADRARARRRAG